MVAHLTGCLPGAELRPDLLPPAPPHAPAPETVLVTPSVVQTELQVDLAPLAEAVEAEVATRFAEALAAGVHYLERMPDGSPVTGPPVTGPGRSLVAWLDWDTVSDDERFRAEFVAEPPRVSWREGGLQVEVDLRYSAALVRDVRDGSQRARSCGCDGRAWCGGGKGRPLSARVRWRLPLSLGTELRLATTPELEHFAVAPCRLNRFAAGGERIEAPQVEAPLRAATAAVGEALARVVAEHPGLEAAVAPLWRGLAPPAPLELPGGPWLRLRPQGAALGPLSVLEGRARMGLRLALRPLVVPEPEPFEPEPLVAGVPPDAEGFRVLGTMHVPFDRLQARVAAGLIDRRFPNGAAQRSVKITGVKVYGTEQGAAVQINFTGTFKGRLVLEGRLEVDGETVALRVADPELTADSVQALAYLYDETQLNDLSLRRTPWIDGDALEAEVAALARLPLQVKVNALVARTVSSGRYLGTPSERLFLSLTRTEYLDVSQDEHAAHVLYLMAGQAGLEFGSALLPLPSPTWAPGAAVPWVPMLGAPLAPPQVPEPADAPGATPAGP